MLQLPGTRLGATASDGCQEGCEEGHEEGGEEVSAGAWGSISQIVVIETQNALAWM